MADEQDIKTDGMQYRTGDIILPEKREGERGIGDDDSPPMKFTVRFSSETPVAYRDFFSGEQYYEVLSHDVDNIDFGRMRSGRAPFLESHDMRELDSILGVVSNPRVVNKESFVDVELDDEHERSVQLARRMQRGFVRNVSVGFLLQDQIADERDESGKRILTYGWEPHEVSLVSVGADRMAEAMRQRQLKLAQRGKDMATEATESADAQLGSAQRGTDASAAQAAESMRQEGIRAALNRHAGFDGDLHGRAAELMTNGGTGKDLDDWVIAENQRAYEEKAARNVQAGNANGATGDGDIGLSEQDKRKFSLTRAIDGILQRKHDHTFNCHELDVMMAANQRLVRDNARPPGSAHTIPDGILGKRVTVTGSTPGSNLIQTDLLAGSFIEYLSDMMPLLNMVTRLDNQVGNVEIDRDDAELTPGWRADTLASKATDVTPTINKISMSPKSLGIQTKFSRLMARQSSIGLDNYLMRKLERASNLGIHFGVMVGGATNGPVGVVKRLNAGDAARSSQTAAANTWTYDELVDVEAAIETSNALEGDLAYVANATVKGHLRKTKIDSPGSGVFLVDRNTGLINGYPLLVANQLEADFTYSANKANYQQSGTKQGLLFGNFSDVLLASWVGNDLIVDEYTDADANMIRLVLHNALDVNIRREESFHVIVSA